MCIHVTNEVVVRGGEAVYVYVYVCVCAGLCVCVYGCV